MRAFALLLVTAACGGGDDEGERDHAPTAAESRPAAASADARAGVGYILVRADALRVSATPAGPGTAVPPGELEANLRELLGRSSGTAEVVLIADDATPAARALEAVGMLMALGPRLGAMKADGVPAPHAARFVPLPRAEPVFGTGRYVDPVIPRPPPRAEKGPARIQVILHPERLILVESWNTRIAIPHVGGRPDQGALQAALERHLRERYQLLVVVSAEAETTAPGLIDILDAVIAAGIESVAPAPPDAEVFVMSWGAGHPRGDSSRRAGIPSTRIGAGTVTDGLDPPIIRRYLRRRLAHLTYCYEKRLMVDPGLKGTVTVRFTIEASGAVRGSTASGVNPDVAACIAEVISTITFPKPRRGVTVEADYPLELQPTGG